MKGKILKISKRSKNKNKKSCKAYNVCIPNYYPTPAIEVDIEINPRDIRSLHRYIDTEIDIHIHTYIQHIHTYIHTTHTYIHTLLQIYITEHTYIHIHTCMHAYTT